MLLLDHPSVAISHEAVSLFSNWQFWVAAFTVISGMVTSYFRQVGMINIIKLNLKNIDEKYDARINSMKEQINTDRSSVRENHKQLYDLCTQMNERLANMEGVLKNGRE